jgi:polyferredoxin
MKDEQNQHLNKMITLPSRLTAENGAKALLIGEFFEEIEVRNEEYCGCGECGYCIDVQDEDATETIIQRVPVSWSTIKDIYNKIASHHWE